MYYDSIEEAKQSSHQWTHIVTPSLDWNGRSDVKGKYCAVQRKGDGFFYRVQDGVRLQVQGNGWEVVAHVTEKDAPSLQPTQVDIICNMLDQASAKVTAARFDQAASTSQSATERQIGGDHYKSLKIQTHEYIEANNLPFLEGNVVKYVTRHASKNGVQDIDKAIHYLELIKQMRYAEDNTVSEFPAVTVVEAATQYITHQPKAHHCDYKRFMQLKGASCLTEATYNSLRSVLTEDNTSDK